MRTQKPKVVFDTTYFLPLYGLTVTQLEKNKEKWIKFIDNGLPDLDFYIPSTVFREITQLLLKEYKTYKNKDILIRYSLGTRSIDNNSHFTIVNPLLIPEMTELAFSLRFNGQKDFSDCLIAGCALALNALFISEDDPLKQKLSEIIEYKHITVMTWFQFQEKYLS